MTKLFPGTREVNVTLIAVQVQKSARIVGDAGSIKPQDYGYFAIDI